jgi:hypothetical protein
METFFGIIMYFLPTFPVLELKITLMGIPSHRWRGQWSCRGVPSRGLSECFERMVGDFITDGQFLPDANGEFVFAKEAWSGMPACYWMPEIRLAIPLLTSLTLPLVWVPWQ